MRNINEEIKKSEKFKHLTNFFGGAEGAFQENIHRMVINLESVRIQSVRIGKGLDYYGRKREEGMRTEKKVYYDGKEPKEDIQEMVRQSEELLNAVLEFRCIVAELSGLLLIGTEKE